MGKTAASFRLIRANWVLAREGVIAEMRSFLERTPADPHRGRAVFRKLCGQCHRIHGEGET
ncbi:MAG: hypothetical protein HC779_03205, partial [Phyllobacteriaceae bacterium]|nr:hypothetical protein [Phyllobacteriaceae bacterium]